MSLKKPDSTWYARAALKKFANPGRFSLEQRASRMESAAKLAMRAAVELRREAEAASAMYGVIEGDRVVIDGWNIEGVVAGVDSRGVSVKSDAAFFPYVQNVSIVSSPEQEG